MDKNFSRQAENTAETGNVASSKMPKPKNVHENHRSRLREKAKKNIRILETYELLELFLYDSIPMKDTNPIAHELINRYVTLKNLLDTSWRELFAVPNMTERASVNIYVLGELFRRLKLEGQAIPMTIKDSNSFINYIQSYLEDSNKEEALMVCLASDHTILGTASIGVGDFDNVTISPREIVSEAIYRNAAKVLLAHNHPSGNNVASSADYRLTNIINSALNAIRVELLDHVIISKNKEYYSIAKDQLYRSKYRLEKNVMQGFGDSGAIAYNKAMGQIPLEDE